MTKTKVRIEYPLNQSSKDILWNAISTTAGLERWFADRVNKTGKLFSFQWGKTEKREANLVSSRSDSFIRFHWTDDSEPKTYFEMRIVHNELTSELTLEIVDFAEEDEEDDVYDLWDMQIKNLRRAYGL